MQYSVDRDDAAVQDGIASTRSQSTPITVAGPGDAAALRQSRDVESRDVAPAVVNHYNVQPVFDVYASADRRDLGGVAREVDAIVAKDDRRRCRAARRSSCAARCRACATRSPGLGLGIVFAILLVYIILVVNFQSWLDPLIIIMALPGALAGIVWMLYVTHTTFTVPSLMGAIMAMGVATANSVLLITFADDQRQAGRTRGGGGGRRRLRAAASGVHDGARDDHRHAADGARARRGRRAERAARPRR